MVQITFIEQDGTDKTIDAKENWSLMEIALEHNIKGIDGLCGGSMACATCHCYIHPDWKSRVESQDNELSPEEEDMLDVAFHVTEHSRLGCQIKVTQAMDGLIVALPGSSLPDAFS
jgi:2Fe-2S ferredoxin